MDANKYDTGELCRKITQLFPDLGECGIDLNVQFNEEENTYFVEMSKGDKKFKTFLEMDDAAICMSGKQCVSLGIHISQFMDKTP